MAASPAGDDIGSRLIILQMVEMMVFLRVHFRKNEISTL